MGIKLGIIVDPTVESAKWAASKGLHYLEYCYNGGNDVAVLEARVPELQKVYAQYDLRLGALGRWNEEKIAPDGSILPEAMDNTRRLIDVAATLGAPVFNTGVNYVESLT